MIRPNLLKWFARFLLTLPPLGILSLWVYGNYQLFTIKHEDSGFMTVLLVATFAIDAIVVVFVGGFIVVNIARIGRWVWVTAELTPKSTNRL